LAAPEEAPPEGTTRQPSVLAVTPQSGTSAPLIELPLFTGPPLIHEELKTNEEAILERIDENASRNVSEVPTFYVDEFTPTNLAPVPARGPTRPAIAPVSKEDVDASVIMQPPDTDMDVGAGNHVVTAYNSVIKVYDKGGTLLAGPTKIQSLFQQRRHDLLRRPGERDQLSGRPADPL